MQLSPHLCFDGRCEEAFGFYRQLLGGTLGALVRYGETPLAAQVPPHWQGRILHATLAFDGQELFGADAFPDAYQRPQGFFVTLSLSGLARARDLFKALAEGGEVRTPLQQTFWSAGFGVLVDRYGVPWEINCGQGPP